jgi:hypothetical protein
MVIAAIRCTHGFGERLISSLKGGEASGRTD